jgi:NTE family protein
MLIERMKFPFAVLIILLMPPLLPAQTRYIVRPSAQNELKGFHGQTQRRLDRPKVGLVLSGGGARALAQIGVLRVLENHHIPVDLIVGNSLGSVVGGLYASGYTVAQIESVALHVNWDDLLSFSEDIKRSDLFLEQKQSSDFGYLVIRLDGLQPIIPSSISNGQRVTNFFMNLTLQALYHPDPGFDQLKIPFRSVATDLRKGKRVILGDGSLAEAMRASITVPFLYPPLEKDSMALVDGGLLSNIPVDVAKSLGCDVVIVVNSTSLLRNENEVTTPWEMADQIMTIMMQSANKEQLKMADVVITPDIGAHSLARFEHIDSLIAAGERSAEQAIPDIEQSIRVHSTQSYKTYDHPAMTFRGDTIPVEYREQFLHEAAVDSFSTSSLEADLTELARTGRYSDVYAEVIEQNHPAEIVFHVKCNPQVHDVICSGCSVISADSIRKFFLPLKGKVLNLIELQSSLEEVLHTYRQGNYSLAKIDSVGMDTASRTLNVIVNEGILGGIRFEGNDRTRDYVIRREFPLDKGDVFNLQRVYTGLTNIASTGLFEYVLVDIRYEGTQPFIVLKVKEKPDELLLLGLHGDNEHGLVSMIDLRDADFRGAGEDIGILGRYGLRDRGLDASYRANRIFQSYLAFNLNGYYQSRDIYTYADDPTVTGLHWNRIEVGRYRDIKYGGSFALGEQIERLGLVSGEVRIEHHAIDSISGIGYSEDAYELVALRLQSTIDTQDKFVFPTSGMYFNLAYDNASRSLGSDVAYTKFTAVYETYLTFLSRNTIHPKITFGFADQTLPLSEQYSLGGLQSMFGVNEDDRRGRQLFLVNTEYRYLMPFKILYDTYGSIRYDLGTISAVPEELKLSSFRHGIGIIMGMDTPIGAASFGTGVGFIFERNLPNQPLSTGPVQFYFSIGPSIY